MGRDTRGVRGISLREGEDVVGMVVTENGEREILAISENGYGKRSRMEDYTPQGRGGRGRITLKTTERVGRLVAIRDVVSDDGLMIVTQNGLMIRMNVGDISVLSRNTQGVRLIHLKKGDAIADVTRLVIEENGNEGEEEGGNAKGE